METHLYMVLFYHTIGSYNVYAIKYITKQKELTEVRVSLVSVVEDGDG